MTRAPTQGESAGMAEGRQPAEARELLARAVEEAARLLHADGAIVYLVDPVENRLRFEVDAGIRDPEAQKLIRDLSLPVGVGLFGHTVSRGEVVVTGNYPNDSRFSHSPIADRIVTLTGIRSMAAAPLIADGAVLGALGAYTSRVDDFGEAQVALLRALADHAAAAIANQRLIGRLARSQAELQRRVEAQRSVGEIAARITAIREPDDVLQRTLDEAVRLLEADGGRIELIGPGGGLHWAFGHSAIDLPIERDEEAEPVVLNEGVSGRAVIERRVVRTGDYLVDQDFTHADGPDRYIREHGIRSVMSAPLIGEEGPIGSITVHSQERHAFDEANAELLQVLGSQAAIAVTNARLYARLGLESAALARQIDSQRRLLQINQSLLSTLEPAAVLELIADGLKSVVWYDNLGVYRVEDETVLRPVLARDRNAAAVLGFPIAKGTGLTWWSVEHRESVMLNDALSDPRVIQIPGTPLDPEAIIIVPLVSGDEVIGAMNIGRVGGPEVAFTDLDFELVQLFATQAAAAVTNARLYEALRERADAQRSLAEIASEITSLHDPVTVLQHAVADAARLLRADRAQVNLVREGTDLLDPPIASAPTPPSADDVVVPIGSGIAGKAAAECRVCWTGDYLADTSFPHDEGDERIRKQGIRSMMAAPLREADRLMGTITVQSNQPNAFGQEQGELLTLLADQAAIALTNARLYAELGESERRYRHLVDYSPDIVWSLDAEGNFTFLSDSLEARTGWQAQSLIGKPFTVLADRGSMEGAQAAWAALRENPHEEQRVRLDLPLANGEVSQAEVAMAATVIDGRFAGAHGSVRDISERERLEEDLREQAAEVAASQERAHLARELHDSVTQALFSMGLTLRALEILMKTDVDAAFGKVMELRELQKDALAEMRTLIFELRPASLEADGLVRALRTHATAVQRRTGLALVVDAEPIPKLALATEEALYRIGQEAIHNVVKHANATQATVRLAREADRVSLTVIDDGVGFSPEDVPRGHLGLLGMRQRMDLVGGDLRVESTLGRGTTIEANVPAVAGAAE